ncbi:hypothetical protein SEA_MEMENTOMORI_22 [Microbacterium phage MementoMori]|uniref:Uncharacterized protein n=1 Tax=Microbacterium phage MementoMori TaxID=2201436 RepID=A0A2Z4Q5F5_9CAUD|nr:hypothetical protein HOT41_gp87 [Microbacterium phage MementoMori]AWY05276.1 hypothetical protein SEA_MEMENTOMORI_22 [Microbacterium phage MementoMori]
MGDCGCNKRGTAPTGSTASRQAAQAVADQTAASARQARERAANPSTTRIGPATTSAGRTQTFALRGRDGSTSIVGSALEARAAVIRNGSQIVPS